jgi:hypothetical protein
MLPRPGSWRAAPREKKNKLASDPRTMSNARSRQLAYFKDNIQTQDDQVESSMTCLN